MKKNKMEQMTRFTQIMSPMSWLFVCFVVFPSLFIIFRPTLLEMAIMLLVDFAAVGIVAPIERFSFFKMYPDIKLYFPHIHESRISSLSTQEVRSFLHSVIRFPARRALFIFLGSYIKVMIPGLVIVFYWSHPHVSNLHQFLMYAAVEVIIQAYIATAAYIELHKFVSEKIEEWHKEYNWAEAFINLEFPKSKHQFILPENIALLSIGIFTVLTLGIVILSGRDRPSNQVALEAMVVGFSGLILFSRIHYLNRKFFIHGLESLFEYFGHVNYSQGQAIALHSSPVLARFEQVFNQLVRRLRSQEEEISRWVLHETEQSRFRAIGEISGLIVHDLAGPLHVAQFCTDEILENPESSTPELLTQLKLNVMRSVELVDSLRAYLRNPTTRASTSFIWECHSYVIRLLSTQFKHNGFERVQFDVDHSVSNVAVKLSQIDFIHILYNLYKNSVENLLGNSIENPKISVSIISSENGLIHIAVTDNGTGLTKARFQQLTGLQLFTNNQASFREGLGLRLTRRLIERNEGSLDIVEEPLKNGTVFSLKLKAAKLNVSPDNANTRATGVNNLVLR